MEAKVILTKTGQMNMGGYFKEKTVQLTEKEGFTYCYRVSYVGDYSNECFRSLEDAKARFAQLSESIILILNDMNANTIKTKICLTCEGEGKLYEDTSRQCTKTPWQECCGGCGYEVTCETCDGTGEVEEEDED